MSLSTIERRYATALMRMCSDDSQRAQTYAESLDMVSQLFAIEAAAKVLYSPVMPRDLKIELINYALSKTHKNPDLEKFIQILADAQRISLLPGIAKSFHDLLNAKQGIVKCEITSAVELDGKTTEAVESAVKRKIANCKSIELSKKVNPDLLGGLVLRFGNSILDLSLRSKLDVIAREKH